MRYRLWALTRHGGGNDSSDLLRSFYKVCIGKVGVARRGAMPVVPEEPTDDRQTFARHDRLTCGGVVQVMQAQAAELRIRSDRAPAGREAVGAPAFGVARKQERIGVVRIGQRGDVRPRRPAERHRARAGFRIAKVDGVLAETASGEWVFPAARETGR